MGLRAALIACLVALGACCGAALASGEDAAPLPPPRSFAISYERGGGLAPSTEKLVVAPGRRALAESSGTRAGERRVSFRIGRRRVLALELGLRRAHFGSIEGETNPTCADCFSYSIRYRGHRVDFDESRIPARLDDVIGELEAVITAHTIPPNA